MELLFVFAPGLISTSLLEKLRNKHFSNASYLKHVFLFDFFINLISVFIYHVIFRGENFILENFNSNSFLIRYAILCLLIAFLLAFAGYFLLPHISVTTNTKDIKTEESANESEQSHAPIS